MPDLGLKSFDKLYPMMIRKYQDLIVDQNASEADKINSIILKLNALGKLSNDVVRDWNTVYNWAMNDGLNQDVSNKLEAMRANGEISQLLQNIFDQLVGDMTTLHTTAKDTLVNVINEVDDLAKLNQTKLGDLTTLQTADKDTIVHAINDNVASLAQNTTQQNSIYVNALYPPTGQTAAKGDGVTDDTTALNNLIQYCYTNGYVLFLPARTYILTNSLMINMYPGLKIIGASRNNTILKMTTNNVPIIQSTAMGCHSVEIRNMKLLYATQQTYASQPNSYAIAFSNPTSNGGGNYFWILDNLWIQYATIGIGINQASGSLPIWCFTFTNIIMYYVEHNAFNLVSPSPAGALGNVIENFSIQNGGSMVSSGPCLKLTGEMYLKNIDIEEWYNEVINWNTALGTLELLHVENHYFTGTFVDCVLIQGLNVTLKDLSFTYYATDTNLAQIYLLSLSQGGFSVENVWANGYAGNVKAASLLAGASNAKISVKNYKFNTGEVLYYGTNAVPYVISDNNLPLAINSLPTTGSYTLGWQYRNSSFTAGSNLGWVCTRAGKMHNNSTATATNGSNTLTNVSDISNWSIGDKPICPGIGDGTTVTSVNTSTNTLTLSSNFQAGSGTVTLNECIFTPYGTIRNSSFGTATLNTSATTVTVTHNLGTTPTNVTATPQGNVGAWWITNINSTQFTFNCGTAPASNTSISWRAES